LPRRKQPGWSKDNLETARPELLLAEFFGRARPKQYPVWRKADGAPDNWLVIGGRGSGKTLLGAHWVDALVRGLPPFATARYGSIALVGETLADVREVMVEGPAGLLQAAGARRPRFEPSRRRLVWEATGAVAYLFSAEDPDSLRGPQFDAAWCDEVAKWREMEATFDMLQFGLRLGQKPLQLWTTTPRPVPLVKRLMADPAVHVTRMATADNAANLAPGFLAAIKARYAGSRLGRQELDGELVEDREDALWKRDRIEAATGRFDGEVTRIVVAVDPPATSGRNSDACGIVAAGLTSECAAHHLVPPQIDLVEQAGVTGKHAVGVKTRQVDAGELAFDARQACACIHRQSSFLLSASGVSARMTKPTAHQAVRLAAADPISIVSTVLSSTAMPNSRASFTPAAPPKTRPQARPTAKRIAASRRPFGKM